MASETGEDGKQVTASVTERQYPDEVPERVDDHVSHTETDDHVPRESNDVAAFFEPLGPLLTYHSQLLDLEMEVQLEDNNCDTLTSNGSAEKDVNHNDAMPSDNPTFAGQRSPKKLFDDSTAETLPDVTLKDEEDQNLRKFARERRRIIDNQVVRRKKFENWAFSTSVDETNDNCWLEALRHFEAEDVRSPTETVNDENMAKVNGTMDQFSIKSSMEVKTKIGTVDSASIIENKQNLRVFWERRIMAEQASANGPIKPVVIEENDVSPPDSLNGDVNLTVQAPAPENKPIVEESPTIQPSMPETNITETTTESSTVEAPPVVEVPVEATSETMEKSKEATDVVPEVPVAAVAEEQQNQLNEETVQQTVDSTEPSVSLPTEEPKVEIVSDTVEKVETPTEEIPKPAEAPVVIEATEPVVTSKPEETVTTAPSPPQEQPAPTELVVEIVEKNQQVPEEVVVNKPQIIGETYHNVTKTQQPSSPKVPVVVLKKTIPSPTERTFKAESLIALEIQEMQKREEELKKMRERAVVDNTPPKPPSESNVSEGGSIHSDDSLGQSPPESLSKTNVQNVQRTISLEAVPNGPAYNIGYAFGRKDNVKVKPLVEPQESDDEKSKTNSFKETPIEKEIRIAREREEELRKEKGLQVENGHEESLVRPTSLIKPRSSSAPKQVIGDTQRILATSRIQQEIEEQTEREKTLRASGVIKTISQERTDARVTGARLGDLQTNGESASPDKTPLSPVSSNGDKPVSPISNGTSSPVNGKMNGSVKTPSPSNSTVSSSPVQANTAGRRFSNPPPGRGVNMQRFISSKGKDLAFNTFNGNGLEKSNSLVALNSEMYELKPPQIPVQNKLNNNQRRSVTKAGPRIQEELKEMQEREDELKKQRARMLGLSQPNLSVVQDDDDIVTNGHDEKPSLERSNSIPNLVENGENQQNGHAKNEKNVPVGGARRRSTLIDQWEQRIQKTDIKS